MGRLEDQTGMGLCFVAAAAVVTLVAGGAGQVVGGVEMNGMAAQAASISSLGGWCSAAAEKEQQKSCQEQGRVDHEHFRQESRGRSMFSITP